MQGGCAGSWEIGMVGYETGGGVLGDWDGRGGLGQGVSGVGFWGSFAGLLVGVGSSWWGWRLRWWPEGVKGGVGGLWGEGLVFL